MSRNEPSPETTELLRSALKRQYHAALTMLVEAIEQCPDELWYSDQYLNRCWQLAYHTLYFAHQYMMPGEAAWVPWKHHQADVQYDDCIAGPPDPESKLPLLPRPYTREQALEYWKFCDDMVDGAVDALDLMSPESGFRWYAIPKLEHQILNVRHIQHGAAQLADRLRSQLGLGIAWAGSRRAGRAKITD